MLSTVADSLRGCPRHNKIDSRTEIKGKHVPSVTLDNVVGNPVVINTTNSPILTKRLNR